MVTAEAATPDKIRLGFNDPDWLHLQKRVDFGQLAGEMAVGRHVARRAGDVIAATSTDEVGGTPEGLIHYVDWSLPTIQMLRMRILYAQLETNFRTGRLMHEVRADDQDELLYMELWHAENELKRAYLASQGEPYPEVRPDVISYLEGGY